MRHPLDVDPEVLADVQDDEIGSLLTPAHSTSPHHADVYVVSLAVQLTRTGLDVTVVCDEDPANDNPRDVTVPTGCAKFGIPCMTLIEFLEAEGIL